MKTYPTLGPWRVTHYEASCKVGYLEYRTGIPIYAAREELIAVVNTDVWMKDG